MNVPSHYKAVSRGFWQQFENDLPNSVFASLPCTADRLQEAVHFAEMALAVLPADDQSKYINWYTSAHMAAYISIYDTAGFEIEKAEPPVTYETTPLHFESRANAGTADPKYKDPLNANALYRARRNLRVHFGTPLVELASRPFVSDCPHWYIRPIDPSEYRKLQRAPLTDQQLSQYNGYLESETIMDVFGRMLSTIREAIIESARLISAAI